MPRMPQKGAARTAPPASPQVLSGTLFPMRSAASFGRVLARGTVAAGDAGRTMPSLARRVAV